MARHLLALVAPPESLFSSTPHGTPDRIRRMDYSKYIAIEPGKWSGRPCIRGLRISVYDVLKYLASGMIQEQILDDFPDVTADDIRACLAFAAGQEKRLVSTGA
jgi:uncharacterized protein (DUF433 family)